MIEIIFERITGERFIICPLIWLSGLFYSIISDNKDCIKKKLKDVYYTLVKTNLTDFYEERRF